jgi:hypothetical protein
MDADENRKKAIKHLEDRQEFRTNLVSYVLVNLFLIGVWAATGAGYFWPVWVILGWGIGLAFHAWNVYGRRGPTEEQIQEEMRRGDADGPTG